MLILVCQLKRDALMYVNMWGTPEYRTATQLPSTEGQPIEYGTDSGVLLPAAIPTSMPGLCK